MLAHDLQRRSAIAAERSRRVEDYHRARLYDVVGFSESAQMVNSHLARSRLCLK